MDIITSRDNAGVKYACTLRDSEKQRAAEGLFFAEGPKLCLELTKSCTPRTAYATEAAMGKTPALESLRPTLIAPHVAEKLAGTKTSQGVFVLFEQPAPPVERLDTATHILALEGVQDPGNVGTLLRSAAAFGFDGVLLSKGCAAPFAPKTLRASIAAAARTRRGLPGCGALPFPPAGRSPAELPGRPVRRDRQRGTGLDGRCRAGLRYGGAHPDDGPGGKPERRGCR